MMMIHRGKQERLRLPHLTEKDPRTERCKHWLFFGGNVLAMMMMRSSTMFTGKALWRTSFLFVLWFVQIIVGSLGTIYPDSATYKCSFKKSCYPDR